MIHWPFVIVGTLAMVTSFLFIPLLLLPLKMPIVQEEEPSGGMNKSEKAESLKICEVQGSSFTIFETKYCFPIKLLLIDKNSKN